MSGIVEASPKFAREGALLVLFGFFGLLGTLACATQKCPPRGTPIARSPAEAPPSRAPAPAAAPVTAETISPPATALPNPADEARPFWPKATSLGLGEARVDFAKYVNEIHARVHPIFADQFLAGLDKLPSSDPLNDPALSTTIAVVVRGETGALVSSKIAGSSGVAAFDKGALDALERAFPTTPPPASCWSADGRVYLAWEFHRGPEACGSWNARPFKLAFEK